MSEGQGKFNLGRDSTIKSALEMYRDLKAPREVDGEKVLMHGQGAYDDGNALRSTWKMGRLFLTRNKLSFYQGQNRILEISIDLVSKLDVIDRNWIPGKVVEQLRLTREIDGMKRIFHLSVRNTEQWKEAIEKLKKEAKEKVK